MFYPILGALSLLTILALATELIIWGDSSLHALALIPTAICMISAKWFIYSSEWRWSGLVSAAPWVVWSWRWAFRATIAGIVVGGFYFILRPEMLNKIPAADSELLMGRMASALCIFIHIWFLGFVLFGDQAAVSLPMRGRIRHVEKRLLDWKTKTKR